MVWASTSQDRHCPHVGVGSRDPLGANGFLFNFWIVELFFQRVQDLLKISSGDMRGHIPWGPQVTTQPPWLLRHNENYASTQQIFRNANTMIWAIGMGTLDGRGRVNSLRTKCSDLERGVWPPKLREKPVPR